MKKVVQKGHNAQSILSFSGLENIDRKLHKIKAKVLCTSKHVLEIYKRMCKKQKYPENFCPLEGQMCAMAPVFISSTAAFTQMEPLEVERYLLDEGVSECVIELLGMLILLPSFPQAKENFR